MERKMPSKSIEHLRDCVKQALSNGCSRGHEFIKMRQAIIVELGRVGYNSAEIKDKLMEWNDRCERPLSAGEARRQLLKYVDWVDKHECKMGCGALEDYCLGKGECQFYLKISHQNREKAKELPFNMSVLEQFLAERFKADWVSMVLVIKAIRHDQVEKAKGDVVCIGVRALRQIIRDKLGHTITEMDIHRKMKLLADEGILKIVSRGKPGSFSWQANCYKFLPWGTPSDTHNNLYV